MGNVYNSDILGPQITYDFEQLADFWICQRGSRFIKYDYLDVYKRQCQSFYFVPWGEGMQKYFVKWISIAQAILKDELIVILNEDTSSVDPIELR